MSQPETTTPAPGEEDACPECYVIGVMISLVASSIQSLAYFMWRLHHLRRQRSQVAPVRACSDAEMSTILLSSDRAREKEEGTVQGAQRNGDENEGAGVAGDSTMGSSEELQEPQEHTATQDYDSGRAELGAHTNTRTPLKCWQTHSFHGIPWVWVCGLALIGVGNGMDFVSLGLTKQSVVTLVGSWSLVVTTLLSPFLGETLTRMDMLASGITMLGIILTVLGGFTEVTDWGTDRLIAQYSKPHVVAMLSVLGTLASLVALILVVDFAKRLSRARAQRTALERPNKRTIGPLYILLAALIATFTVLLGKTTSEMLLPTIMGDDRFTNPAAIMLVSCFLVSLPSQLLLISASLAINDSLYHVPTFYIIWILGTITTGALFYEEMENFETHNWVLFVVGVVTLLVGVILTNVSASRKPPTA
eukprot:CAMPEP_0206240444 /NCGR_PEP_ID=MMETSP0047_2-20121206/15942_1 /ASSEMBLY_ACC=CAM_ASM_000192 /TAXON_ID=195065 /ORGANISM="Chroomonas mesostigmatica_cf, Strain CCMP1168" /LENGTH=419 /DNA_ID=CAMNT_0053665227 /DNA_START=42 /DNA_END=1301 /DNA_ORIENTATION=-